MKKSDKKQIYVSLIVIFFLFCLSFVFFYFYDKSYEEEKVRVNQSSLEVSFTKNKEIYLSNVLPVSDKIGKEFSGEGTDEGIQGYTEFSVQNVSDREITYEIYVTKDTGSENEIPNKFVKLYLTDELDKAISGFDTNKVPDFSSLLVLVDKPESLLIYKDTLSSKTTKSFKLRSWLADTYAVTMNKEELRYSVDVRVV